jgi:BolA protein
LVVQQKIEQKLLTEFSPEHLQVINESNNHNVPAGSESHFKVVMVSEAFAGKRLIQRHRLINAVLKDELAHDIHALALHTYTAEEWEKQFGEYPDSPNCLGGGK